MTQSAMAVRPDLRAMLLETTTWPAPAGGPSALSLVYISADSAPSPTNSRARSPSRPERLLMIGLHPPMRFSKTTGMSQSTTEPVTVTFDPEGHDTRVIVTHSEIPSQE